MQNIEKIEFGLQTFGDVSRDDDRNMLTHAQTIRNVLDEAILADEIGIDAIGLGEHHRAEYAISSPETLLAGIATRTQHVRLGTAVTVLSTDDPVRVFERFATVDALSNGRAEVVLGRGSFTESYPLFGYPLEDYEVLFEEKIDLFHKLLDEKPVTWEGTVRPSLHNADVFPKTESGRLRTWVGVGGSPQSVIRTAHYGFRLMLAVIGGAPERFAPYIDLYHRAAEQLGKPVYPVGMHSHGFIAETDEEAKELYYADFKAGRDTIGAERGWPPMRREQFEDEVTDGALFVGSPETVARKLATTIRGLGLGRMDLILGGAAMVQSHRMRAIELYGTRVLPMVKDMLASSQTSEK